LIHFQLIDLVHLLADRRALFLSKIQSPAPMTVPKTPPESPRIFHHSLSSPGFEPSLALFESWSGNHADDVPHKWVERVDFRLVDEQSKPNPSLNRSSAKACGVPSLDQISARFPRPARLDDIKMTCDVLTNEHSPRPSVGIGRLRMPLRTQAILQSNDKHIPFKRLPPPLSLVPCATTYVISRSPSSSPAQLTTSNLDALSSRDQKASNMLFTLRKRRLSSEFDSIIVQEPAIDSEEEAYSKLRWRRSAPADMTPLRARFGFEHPVLASPGGF
jgi:hypothetical protein